MCFHLNINIFKAKSYSYFSLSTSLDAKFTYLPQNGNSVGIMVSCKRTSWYQETWKESKSKQGFVVGDFIVVYVVYFLEIIHECFLS